MHSFGEYLKLCDPLRTLPAVASAKVGLLLRGENVLINELIELLLSLRDPLVHSER